MHVFTAADILQPPQDIGRFSWKRLLVFISIVLIIIISFFGIPALVEPTSPPREVFTTNITEAQATITWVTEKPTKGTIKVNGRSFKDDGDKNDNDQGFYTTHHVTVGSLQPSTSYKYQIYQGWKKASEGVFTTAPILEALNNPNPVYGKIIGQNNNPPVGAIIYLTAKNTSGESGLLSTLTNNEGQWQIDLANLRTKDLSRPFNLASDTTQEVVVQTGSIGKFKATTSMENDQPWPDIITK